MSGRSAVTNQPTSQPTSIKLAGLLCLLATVTLLGAAQTAPTVRSGYHAEGVILLETPAGEVGGTIVVDAWGTDHRHVVVRVPGLGEFDEVVAAGKASIRGPEIIARLMVAGGPAQGCVFLVQATRPAHASLSADPASGLPSRLDWTGLRHRPVEVQYSQYQTVGGLTFASHVEKAIAGARQWAVDLQSVKVRPGFTEADFAAATGGRQ